MTDHLIAVCASCGHTVRVSVEHGGRRARCPKCESVIQIPKSDTSVRLRSDRELTNEARAKAGRTGPDSDPEMEAARGGRTAARPRRAPKKKPRGRRLVLVLTLVATVAILAAIVLVLAGRSGETAAAPRTSGIGAMPSVEFQVPDYADGLRARCSAACVRMTGRASEIV